MPKVPDVRETMQKTACMKIDSIALIHVNLNEEDALISQINFDCIDRYNNSNSIKNKSGD